MWRVSLISTRLIIYQSRKPSYLWKYKRAVRNMKHKSECHLAHKLLNHKAKGTNFHSNIFWFIPMETQEKAEVRNMKSKSESHWFIIYQSRKPRAPVFNLIYFDSYIWKYKRTRGTESVRIAKSKSECHLVHKFLIQKAKGTNLHSKIFWFIHMEIQENKRYGKCRDCKG